MFFVLGKNFGNMHHQCSNRNGEWNKKTGGTHRNRRNVITTGTLPFRSSCNWSTGCMLHCGCGCLHCGTLWVFHEKGGDMGERNTENLQQVLQRHSCRRAKDWSTNSAVVPRFITDSTAIWMFYTVQTLMWPTTCVTVIWMLFAKYLLMYREIAFPAEWLTTHITVIGMLPTKRVDISWDRTFYWIVYQSSQQ
jgi:hypothetical protein